MRRSRVDEEREAELAHVPEPLERRRIDQLGGESVEPDVVPEGVTDDFDRHAAYDTGGRHVAPDRSTAGRRKPLHGDAVRNRMRTLQTPRPASPPAAPVTAPAGQTQGTVNLAQQLADLRIQEAGLAAQKNSLRLQLEGMRVDNPARPPVQAKDAEVGVQLAQVRGDIARIQAQLQGQG